MNLKEYVASLTEKQRCNLAIDLIEKLLPIWNNFSNNRKNLEYVDTVVAMSHLVNKDIIERTIKLAKKWIDNKFNDEDRLLLIEWYSDPIVALQDLDWEIPENIQLIFYSAYNLFSKINEDTKTFFADEQIYLVINQAIDSISKSGLMSDFEIEEFLRKYKAPNKS